MFFGPKDLLVAGFARALIGQEVTTKREWLLRGHLNFSTPNTKRCGRHKTEFLFKSLPRWCLSPRCVYLTTVYSLSSSYTRCQHVERSIHQKNKTKKTTTFVYEPTTSRSHQHIWNSIKRSKLDLLKEITLHIRLGNFLTHGLWILQCNKTTTTRSLWGWKWTQR